MSSDDRTASVAAGRNGAAAANEASLANTVSETIPEKTQAASRVPLSPPGVAKKNAGPSGGAASVSQGLRDLAAANRPKAKKKAVKVVRTGSTPSPDTIVGDTVPVTTSMAAPSVLVETTAASIPVPRAAGKRPLEANVPAAATKHARAGASPAKAGGHRGKTARPSEQPSSVEVSPLAATDTKAAELAFHTVSDRLVMPSEYTSSSGGCNRRLAGIASQFFFSAQIGFSQIIMLNDRLSKTVDEKMVEIAKLKKSLTDERAKLKEEVRSELERGFEEKLSKQREELVAEKRACQAVIKERDGLQVKLQQSKEIEKTLLEQQESLSKEVAALKLDKTALTENCEADLAAARAKAGPAYVASAEFQALDKAKYQKIVGDVVAAIRHLFRQEAPDVVWDANLVWDTVGGWTDADVNSEADDGEEEEGGDTVEDGEGSERSPSV
ncbi:unnamed protein product [Linum trigynum]|uniref:Uncharacterized protein n=1 Tax=Linum trigynum TaxID=586398 RepID=A0AAV2GNG4_9ROSI